MSLEQEIKQIRPFKIEAEKCVVNIVYTNNILTIFQNNLVKEHDISVEQFNVLRILKGQKGQPITINGIIDRMLDKMSNASRLVDKLYLKGLVDRKQRETNRRACDVLITPRGEEVLKIVNTGLQDFLQNKVHLELEELQKLNLLLDSFRKSFLPNLHEVS